MPLDRREGMLVKPAVDVVREAIGASGTARGDTSAVRLALRILLPHCPERWPLTMFWSRSARIM
jgi:hypothetical protein